MCGIAGIFLASRVQTRETLRSHAGQMTAALVHRGPDHGGIWVDEAAGIALGHRRLAILDLSPEGEQPMCSSNSRYILVFNGEIYNFQDLHGELAALGHVFRGHSDTEVMLAAFSEWG